jgi:hypothetical protein
VSSSTGVHYTSRHSASAHVSALTLARSRNGSDETRTSESVKKDSNRGQYLGSMGCQGAPRGCRPCSTILPGRLDFNHRPLGYECHHQQNLKTMRGAKSNTLFFRTENCNPACPCVAPGHLSKVSDCLVRHSTCYLVLAPLARLAGCQNLLSLPGRSDSPCDRPNCADHWRRWPGVWIAAPRHPRR